MSRGNPGIPRRKRPLEERMWRFILPEPMSGCWLWMGSRNWGGYGTFRPRYDGTFHNAHRVVYEHFRGMIADGLQIDHLCRNRACVNPAHLEPVTPRVNTHRSNGLSALNARKTHCLRGHELGPPVLGSRRCLECARLSYPLYYVVLVARPCETCGTAFVPKRCTTTRFCSAKCKNKHWWKGVSYETRQAYKASRRPVDLHV